MSDIKTWIERCDEHPDHQSGMISDGMIRARMCEEIEDLRAENERLRNEDTKTRHALKGWVFVCPDGGDEPTHERVAAVVAEVDRLRAEIKRLHNDAMRYRWLRKQKALHLVSDGAVWIRENGKNFRASHALSANNTRYGACETLDETIDEAMRGEIASKDADIERLRKALEAKP